MSADATIGVDRRSFLKTGMAGAAGLVIGFYLPGRFEALAASPAGTVQFHGSEWDALGVVDAARASGRKVLVTP